MVCFQRDDAKAHGRVDGLISVRGCLCLKPERSPIEGSVGVAQPEAAEEIGLDESLEYQHRKTRCLTVSWLWRLREWLGSTQGTPRALRNSAVVSASGITLTAPFASTNTL